MEDTRTAVIGKVHKSLRLENDGEVGVLILDVPGEKVNILSSPIMLELNAVLDELRTRTDIRALVLISGKEGNFIVGAKLQEIERTEKESLRKTAPGHGGRRRAGVCAGGSGVGRTTKEFWQEPALQQPPRCGGELGD